MRTYRAIVVAVAAVLASAVPVAAQDWPPEDWTTFTRGAARHRLTPSRRSWMEVERVVREVAPAA